MVFVRSAPLLVVNWTYRTHRKRTSAASFRPGVSMNVYLMDCYYRDSNAVDGFRQVTISVKAPNETDGDKEARSVAIKRDPDFSNFALAVSRATK